MRHPLSHGDRGRGLTKVLTGILHPTCGEATVLGVVPWLDRRRLAARTGTLFGQRSLLWFELTPRQSYRMLAAIYGLDRQRELSRIGELADLLCTAGAHRRCATRGGRTLIEPPRRACNGCRRQH